MSCNNQWSAEVEILMMSAKSFQVLRRHWKICCCCLGDRLGNLWILEGEEVSRNRVAVASHIMFGPSKQYQQWLQTCAQQLMDRRLLKSSRPEKHFL